MPRDQILKKAFEIADDGIQSVIGYYHYVIASQYLAKEQVIIDYLPKNIVFQNNSFQTHFTIKMFHEWVRYYDPRDLVKTMRSVFTPYHIRTCLLGIVSIFEAFLSNSIDRLITRGKITARPNGYKKRLEWAFQFVLNSNYGNCEMQNRCPILCLDIDHARRIRNLWMHNNGNFNRLYRTDVIMIPNHNPLIVPEYERYKKSPKSKIAFPVNVALFDSISRSHIEALHHIHNMLQTQFFGQKQWYGYKRERKRIEWEKLFFGV